MAFGSFSSMSCLRSTSSLPQRASYQHHHFWTVMKKLTKELSLETPVTLTTIDYGWLRAAWKTFDESTPPQQRVHDGMAMRSHVWQSFQLRSLPSRSKISLIEEESFVQDDAKLLKPESCPRPLMILNGLALDILVNHQPRRWLDITLLIANLCVERSVRHWEHH